MRPKYYVRVNKEGVDTIPDQWDLETTRKADYTKFAKQALKDGAESVDIHALVKTESDGAVYMCYVTTFYADGE